PGIYGVSMQSGDGRDVQIAHFELKDSGDVVVLMNDRLTPAPAEQQNAIQFGNVPWSGSIETPQDFILVQRGYYSDPELKQVDPYQLQAVEGEATAKHVAALVGFTDVTVLGYAGPDNRQSFVEGVVDYRGEN